MQTAELLRIDQRVGELVQTMTHQSDIDSLVKHFDHVVDIIDTVDPSVAQQATAGYAGSSILERCVEHPDQVLLTEVGMMAGMYDGRSLIRTDAGVTATEFITRTPDLQGIDTLYRRLEAPSGNTTVTVESQSWRDMDTTCKIVATEGDCQVIVPHYRRGAHGEVALPIGDGGRGDVIIGTFYAKNLWARASELVLDRELSDRKAADRHALQLLISLQRSRRTI